MIQPLNNYVLVEISKLEKTKSGIILATDNDARLEKGEVIALDPQVDIVKKGDLIYLKLYALSSVEIDDREYHFIKSEDILGVEK